MVHGVEVTVGLLTTIVEVVLAWAVPVSVAIVVPVATLVEVPVATPVSVGVEVGTLVAVCVAVDVDVGVSVAPAEQDPNWNDPTRRRQPIGLVVGTYSLTYQKVQSSTGSTVRSV
jgi:hypothetical protein